jgi:hypothetical protein
MSNRIPPSLAFLARHRKYAAGEIERSEIDFKNRLAILDRDIENAELHLSRLRSERIATERVKQAVLARKISDLNGIDGVIGLHPISVDPTLLGSRRAHVNKRFLPHNVMTRTIYEYLRHSGGERRSVTEIAIYIATTNELTLNDDSFLGFRHAVRGRLKTLAYEGKLMRFLGPTSNAETWYALALEDRKD